MEYKHFIVNAFQQRPAKWRASVKRIDGTPLVVVGPHGVKIAQSITHVDSLSAEDAVRMVIEAIDAGAFPHRASRERASEVAIASWSVFALTFYFGEQQRLVIGINDADQPRAALIALKKVVLKPAAVDVRTHSSMEYNVGSAFRTRSSRRTFLFFAHWTTSGCHGSQQVSAQGEDIQLVTLSGLNWLTSFRLSASDH
jgi:hypothetical protein